MQVRRVQGTSAPKARLDASPQPTLLSLSLSSGPRMGRLAILETMRNCWLPSTPVNRSESRGGPDEVREARFAHSSSSTTRCTGATHKKRALRPSFPPGGGVPLSSPERSIRVHRFPAGLSPEVLLSGRIKRAGVVRCEARLPRRDGPPGCPPCGCASGALYSRSAELRQVRSAPSRAAAAAGSSTTRILTAGLKNYIIPPDYSGITIPEKPKLKIVERAPSVAVKRQPKNLRDIYGPSQEATEFTEGQYGIMALDGGYLRWEHTEMMRVAINRHLNTKTMFALWRFPPPSKPITRKGLGHRMGGGKGSIDHYVTPIKSGRLLVEVGGRCEFIEVEHFLKQVAKKLPFKAKVVSRQSLEEMREAQEERRRNNQNPWTFERIVKGNMLGIRRYVSPYDVQLKGCYWGKFFLPDRV
ncbi:hypothetical protein JRQ81_000151 [Phrynocephalus forsythii]|uniref:Large ribosomal subunit protein uL16m n=1 Tax=Phrynocephalus forsythii TaxID=171643 RepID=A0A9Q0Y733_9SAUR|nr:hypothetical protein JRQ81_000151 [Phrynocephalus forsythii]